MSATKTRCVFGKQQLLALPWASDGALRVRYGSLITKDAANLLRNEAAALGITQIDLLESLARCLHHPEVRTAIMRQFPT